MSVLNETILAYAELSCCWNAKNSSRLSNAPEARESGIVFKVEVREAIGLLNTQWHDHAMRSQQAIGNLLALRTYILAHSLAGSDYITPPTDREVFSLIDPAAEIVIKLGWFSDPHLQNVAGVSERWHRSGREFWDAALRGMRASAG